ncbi:DUF2971 domain-containing protein [Aeromonas dhakensis]|uniref:DUF2971 domain-containing protein n=1 Tax=Aeromonas dhakensis TaxID=196024 RepID=UPI003B9F6CE8
MDILYKYYSGLDITYFRNPTIKISNTSKLNDPFERIIDDELMDLVLKEYPKLNKVPELIPSFNAVNFMNQLSQIGVVSLSETPRNLLMWSHYANQYKGICIGYKSTFLDNHKERKHETLPTIFHPTKVNYDNSRYDPLTDIFLANDEQELRKQIVQMSLLRKGNDWLYEKEHRSIIPMKFHDTIICPSNNAFEIEKKSNYLKAINERMLVVKDDEKVPSNVNINSNLIYALRIEKESIVSIYFGINAENFYDYVELYEEIKEDPELSHVKGYIASPNGTKFELSFDTMENFIDTINNG